MNRTQVSLCCGLFMVALTAALIYRPVVAADPAVPAAQDEAAKAADASLDSVRPDFDALISEIEARLPEPDNAAAASAAGGGEMADQLRTANIQIGILRQAIVDALAARAEAEAQVETLWRDSRAEIDALKAAQAEDATRISALESALAEAKAAGGAAVVASAADADDGTIQTAAYAPADEALLNGAARSEQADDALANIAPGSGPIEVQLGEIHFDSGSADLTPGAKRKTLEAAERIKGLAVSKIRIAGYSDSTGPAAFNKHLSLQRARSIAELLSSVGVSAEIIDLEGNGQDGAPVLTGDQVSEPLNRCAGIYALAELPLSKAAQ